MRTFLIFIALCGWCAAGISQDVGSWTLQAPTSTFQLINAESLNYGAWRFTLKNTSAKPIIEFAIGSVGDNRENAVENDSFPDAAGAIQPGATATAVLSVASDVQELRLEAIVWSDGSHSGNPKFLRQFEGRMIATTLETKRIADLLERSPNHDISAADSVKQAIGPAEPGDTADAANSIRGVDLPGVPRSYLDEHLNVPSMHHLNGVSMVRHMALSEIDRQTQLATFQGDSARQSNTANDAAAHGLTDLAAKYRSLNAAQTSTLIGFMHGEGR